MKIIGSFRDLYEQVISVEIENTTISADTTINIEDDGIIYFDGDEPITIEDNTEELMDVVYKQSATIQFQCKDYVGDWFYGNNDRSVTVKIKKGDTVVFDGYVDPVQFNQDYNSWFDSFSVNCIDKLSTLQYHKYKDIKTKNEYESAKTSSDYTTFYQVLTEALPDHDYIWFDQSFKLPGYDTESHAFKYLKVSEETMFEDDYDNIWTYEDCLTELLRYLNLHIKQIGSDYYLFNWLSIQDNQTEWVNIVDYTHKTIAVNTINITADMHASNDTNVTVDECYNQIKISCDLNDQDSIVESPLDSENLRSLFTNKQKYLTEYISEGEGHHAFDAFKAMILGQSSDYDACKIVDWYMQALYNKNWKFYSSQGEVNDLYDKDENDIYVNQWKLSARLGELPIEPALISVGSVSKSGGLIKDNSNVSKVSMSTYLAISLNGNESDGADHAPSQSTIKSRTPLAEYISTHSATILSPPDKYTTNYLLITGKLCLMPIQKDTDSFTNLYAAANNKAGGHWEYQTLYHYDDDGNYVPWLDPDGNEQLDYDADPTWVSDSDVKSWDDYWHQTVPSDNNDDGRYYTRKWWAQKYAGVKADDDTPCCDHGLMPMTDDKSNHTLQVDATSRGTQDDTLSQVDLLECELIVGNKRCIYYEDKFQWVSLGSEPTVIDSDGSVVTVTTFPIGFNPAKEDYMIGDEFDITNTLTIEDNVDAEGTAIPITKDDNLTGKVIFRILGVVNNSYEFAHQHNHRYWLFWHCSDWDDSKYKFPVSHAESILIKDFKIEMVSDNAGQSSEYTEDDGELIYVSMENDSYINVNDDTSFKFITQPTTAFCLENNISTNVNVNAVLYDSGDYVREITSTISNEMAYPEEHYVAQYYEMMHTPKIELETTLLDSDSISYSNIYHYPPLNRDFQVISMTKNLGDNTVKLKLREI